MDVSIVDKLEYISGQLENLGYYIMGAGIMVVGAICAQVIFDFLKSRGPV